MPVEGQTDILTMGLPYICPYNVNSIMNPILVMCLGLGYFFNLYRGKPLVREGGVLIMSHPTPWEFHPVHHPSYIDFFEQVLADTTDPVEIEAKYEKQFAEDEWYRHLYRTSYAYHGVHPFYMWYWGAHALQHLGEVIIVGGDAAGRAPARLQAGVDAARRVRDGERRRRPPPIDHPPAQPADPHGRRDVSAGPPNCSVDCPVAAWRRPPSADDAVAVPLPRRRRCRGASSRCPRRGARGADYDTDWARRLPGPARRGCCSSRVRCGRLVRVRRRIPSDRGLDRLADLDEVARSIFAANHHSHVDTPLLLTSIPEPWRHQHRSSAPPPTTSSAPGSPARSRRSRIGAIPIERTKVSRRSADHAAELIDDGWSMLIFPEGGRTPDGWGQPFRGGAAYLSLRCERAGRARSTSRAPAGSCARA